MTADTISHDTAAAIAAQWGSYMTAGDPGAIFYTFPGGGKPPAWGPEDKAAAVAYCESCLAIARGRVVTIERHHGAGWRAIRNGAATDSDVTPYCRDAEEAAEAAAEAWGLDPEDSEEAESDVAELESLAAYIAAYDPPAPRVFVSSYFSQGEEGAADCDAIDRDGVESWLDAMAGAIDFTEGETSKAAPWGTSDRLAYEHKDGAGDVVRVHVNAALGYVGITLETEE